MELIEPYEMNQRKELYEMQENEMKAVHIPRGNLQVGIDSIGSVLHPTTIKQYCSPLVFSSLAVTFQKIM